MRAVYRSLVISLLVVAGSSVAAPIAVAQESGAADATVSVAIDVPKTSSPWTSKPMRLSLVGAFAALQALDVVTTTKALRLGGYEANPFVRGMASRPALFISVKTVMTLWTLWSTERMAKRDQAAGAVIGLASADAIYGAVVVHNYQIVNHLK